MSLKYLDEVGLAENIAQEKLYIEGIRAALDAAKQDVIQVTSLGSATADKVGIAYQYMGTTTGSYKHGWFYEAVEVTPATDPATYTWQEFEFGGGLPYAATAPSNPEDGDVFVYIGATNLTYKKGSTYQYSIGTQFYAWGSGNDFTLSETPSVNDVLYNSTGEATPNYVVAYDSVNDAIEDNNGDTMARNSAKDKVMGTGWTLISPYNAGVGLEVDTITNTLSTKIATNHSLGVVKGGSGTNIEANGEITVVNRLLERYEGAGAYIDYSNPIFLYTGETTADFTHGGIYEVTLSEVEPVGTENPSEEGWYEYYNDSTYAPTYDVTVDPQKTYYEATYTLLSSSGFTFNTDDFDVVDSEISLDATQRSFTGTQAEWDELTTTEKAKYTLVNIIDSYDTENILYADMPIGTIVPFGGSGAPTMFLLCDGSEVAKATYPELYEVIGDAFGTASDATLFRLPDLRECVPVGVGKNVTKSIANHDRYNLGQFKDDALGTHDHPLKTVTTATYNTAGVPVGVAVNNTPTTATHGKQVGVNYIIKAKESGMPTDVTEGVRDVVSEMESYTTAETDTGKTWIDGKRIYRKVFTGTFNTGNVVSTDLENIDEITLFQGFTTFTNGFSSMLPYADSHIVASVRLNENNDFVFWLESPWTNNAYKVIIEYTKTT